MKTHKSVLLFWMRKIFGRTWILYAVFMALIMLMADIPVETDNAKIRSLNRLRQASVKPLIAVHKREDIDRILLKRHALYYQKLSEYIPSLAEAWGMRGFTLYHLGRWDEAALAYERALELNPRFFWFHYNLGVSRLRQQRYDLAARHFQNALVSSPQDAVQVITSSQRIYMPVVLERFGPRWQEELVAELKLGYSLGSRLRQISAHLAQTEDGSIPVQVLSLGLY